jgi:hypothetical protein
MHGFAFENRSYFGEFEAEFKKVSASESEAQGVLFDEKQPKVETRDTVPLKQNFKQCVLCIQVIVEFSHLVTESTQSIRIELKVPFYAPGRILNVKQSGVRWNTIEQFRIFWRCSRITYFF